MGYSSDREFTNYVHDNLAIPIIYKQLNWKPQNLNNVMTENVDINNAVDCFLIDLNKDVIVTVQERFREYKYHTFNDFTIRFEREFNQHDDRKLSEFYKLQADYFVYGIINHSKYNKEQATDFVKYAVIDLKILKALFDVQKIVVDRTLNTYYCIERDGKMVCPVNQNKDKSSRFIPIDIKLLKKLFSNENIIVASKGF